MERSAVGAFADFGDVEGLGYDFIALLLEEAELDLKRAVGFEEVFKMGDVFVVPERARVTFGLARLAVDFNGSICVDNCESDIDGVGDEGRKWSSVRRGQEGTDKGTVDE